MLRPITETNQESSLPILEDVYLTTAVQLLLANTNEEGMVHASVLRGQMTISKMLQVFKTLEKQGIISSAQENNQRFIKVEAAQAFLSSLQNASL